MESSQVIVTMGDEPTSAVLYVGKRAEAIELDLSVAFAVMWRRLVRVSYEGTEPPSRLHNSIRTLWRRELWVWPDRQTFLN
jgi:hypothetical protein